MLSELHHLIADARLLTQVDGELRINENEKRLIAVFDNGIVFVAVGERWSAEVKLILERAKERGIAVNSLHEIDVASLMALYGRKGRSEQEETQTAFSNDLERQRDLSLIISRAAQERASDVHIRIMQDFAEIRMRIYGRLKDIGSRSPEEGKAIIKATFAVASDLAGSSSELSFQQGALTNKSGVLPKGVDMVRLQYSPTSDGRGALIMRIKYASAADETDIDTLGYNAQQINDIAIMRRRTNGLYIFAGKVSSGKSTTLQRALNKMNIEKRREISTYTIEEPVELEIPSAIQVPVTKRDGGVDGFAEAMKAALRSDPNVIVLGEIRSQETARLAIQAVMTGHALWSTVHAGSALGILDRLVDLGVEDWKLRDPKTVRGLIYQRLTGVMCRSCRLDLIEGQKKGIIEKELADRLTFLFERHPRDLYVRGTGCQACKSGLAGRTVVAETVVTDETLLEYFGRGDRKGMRDHWIRPVSEGGLGGIPVLHHALSKVGAGIVDINEVEEEVDLLSVYEHDFMHLRPRLLAEVTTLEKGL